MAACSVIPYETPSLAVNTGGLGVTTKVKKETGRWRLRVGNTDDHPFIVSVD